MADENLRLQAEVVDKFSGPLRNLRAILLGTSRESATHAEAVAKGIGRIEGAARSAGQAAQTVLNPALAAIGVTGLGATAALVGIANALKSFGGSITVLGQLGREAGMAADQLRVFQGLASKFGISSDASAGAARQFAQNMRDIRRGLGETMGWLQSQGPVTAEFALKLKNTTNNDDALKLVEDFLEQIPNAVDRGRFAEKLLGSFDFGRLGDKHLGPLRKLRAEIEKSLGPLDPSTVKAAEDFDRAMSALRGNMQRLGTSIATEAMPYVSELVRGMNDIVKGGREDITGPLRQGIRDLGEDLRNIDWKAAATGVRDFVREATDDLKKVLGAVRETAAILKALRDGDVDGVLGGLTRLDRATDAGVGSRKNAPPSQKATPLDESLDAMMRGQSAQSDQQKRISDLEGRLTQRRAELEAEQGRRFPFHADESTVRSLKDQIEKLTQELKRAREGTAQNQGGATVQQQSFDGSGTTFGGARIQTAGLSLGFGGRGGVRSYGGGGGSGAGAYMGGLGGLPGMGGGGGAPYVGGDGVGGGADTRTPMERRDFGGGRFGLGPARPRPSQAPGASNGRPQGQGGGPSGPIAPHKGSRTFDSLAPRIMADLQKDFGLTREQAAGIVGNLGHESAGFRQMQEQAPRGGGAGGYGYAQWTGPRRRAFFAYAKEKGLDPNSYEANYGFLRHELNTTERRGIEAVRRQRSAQGAMYAFENAFERAGVKAYQNRMRWTNRALGLPEVAPGVGGPQPAEPPVANRPQSFREFLQDRAKTQRLGRAENEAQPINPETDVTLDRLNKQLGWSKDEADQIWSRRTEDEVGKGYMEGRQYGRFEFRPENPLSLREIREKYAAPRANATGFRSELKERGAIADAEERAQFPMADAPDRFRRALGRGPATPTLDTLSRNMMEKAVKSGAVSGGGGAGGPHGKVDITVEKPGPDTKVKTNTSGELFKEVRLNRGKAMPQASEVA